MDNEIPRPFNGLIAWTTRSHDLSRHHYHYTPFP
ncbi:hypothetical protein BsWGS_18575 [Bradybaena similaris]